MASYEFKTHRVTALPSVLEAYAMYFVAPLAGNPNYVEIYVTNSDGTSARRVINEQDINTLVDQRISDTHEIVVFDTILDRDNADTALVRYAYVVDASADTTVTSGGASYVYDNVATDWVKTSESESMDLILNWSKIVDGPASSPASIDAAVTASHTHANKTQIDKLGEDVDGNLTYGGAIVSTQWATTNW